MDALVHRFTLYLCQSLLIALMLACSESPATSTQELTESDLQIIHQRNAVVMRHLRTLAISTPFYVSLPTHGDAGRHTALTLGSEVLVVDETTFSTPDGNVYHYIEAADGTRGYVAQDHLVNADYAMALTLHHVSHHFQPNATQGRSSTIFLPAYTAVFSPEAQGNSPFISYHAVDLHGHRLEGYLPRESVDFSPPLVEAYMLYQQAFTHSTTATEQDDIIQKINSTYADTSVTRLANALLDVRRQYDPAVVAFRRGYHAQRKEGSHVAPIYSQPNGEQMVLGYLSDDRALRVVAGYGASRVDSDIRSGYGWYLIDTRGWVTADNIEIKEYIQEADDQWATFLESPSAREEGEDLS
jgi:hypothetical protein